MTLNEFHELHNKSADETRQLINQLSVETDNWRGTGENLVELVKQAIQNYPLTRLHLMHLDMSM